jgi:hypothetical protein
MITLYTLDLILDVVIFGGLMFIVGRWVGYKEGNRQAFEDMKNKIKEA